MMNEVLNAGAKRPILVLGFDRSGTSLVAQMIARWGAFGGDEKMLSDSDEHNPQGYWEYEPIKPFLNELMEGTQVSKFHPTFKMLLKKAAMDSRLKERAQGFVDDMEAAGRPWFWKEPDLSYTLPFWQSFWRNPVFVITVRNPYDSAKSYSRFVLPQEMQSKQSLISSTLVQWQYCLLSVLEGTRSSRAKCFIEYEQLMADPGSQAEALCAFLDRECRVTGDTPERAAHMASTVNTDYWRNRSSKLLSTVAQASREQCELYELLRAKTTNPNEPFTPTKYPLPAGYWEYLEMVDLFL